MKALSPAVCHLVRRLLAAGFSRLETARMARVSPSSVGRIGRGWVRPRPPARPPNEHVLAPDLADPPPDYQPAKVHRCPGCGGQVYHWPCLRCELHGRIEIPSEFKRTPDAIPPADTAP